MGTRKVDVEVAVKHVAELDVGERQGVAAEKLMLFEPTRRRWRGTLQAMRWRPRSPRDRDLVGAVRTTRQKIGVVKPSVTLIFAHSAHMSTLARATVVAARTAAGRSGPRGSAGSHPSPRTAVRRRHAGLARCRSGSWPETRACRVPPWTMADVMALVRQPEFADAPHQRLDVRRGFAAPDGQHRLTSATA